MNIEAKREHEPKDEPMNGPQDGPQDRHAIIAAAFP